MGTFARLIPFFPSITSFSALGEEETYHRLKDARARDVILVGMETHVCVSQTAYDLDAVGFRPVVLADAVISRFDGDGGAAIARLRGDGITVTTTEAVIFELLERAGTEVFSRVRKLIRRKRLEGSLAMLRQRTCPITAAFLSSERLKEREAAYRSRRARASESAPEHRP